MWLCSGTYSRVTGDQPLCASVRRDEIPAILDSNDSTEGLLNAVEAGLGITFVSRWAVRNQLTLGTLKIARVRGLKLARRFSMAYPSGPEPTGNVGAFRNFLLSPAVGVPPKRTKNRDE
jgi:DNA-binding transcriptional LysR family regulator